MRICNSICHPWSQMPSIVGLSPEQRNSAVLYASSTIPTCLLYFFQCSQWENISMLLDYIVSRFTSSTTDVMHFHSVHKDIRNAWYEWNHAYSDRGKLIGPYVLACGSHNFADGNLTSNGNTGAYLVATIDMSCSAAWHYTVLRLYLK